MPQKKYVKKTKAKVRNVSQIVTVNIHKGKKSSAPTGPPRPTPLQQALQFASSFRQPNPHDAIVQSATMLHRLLEPTNLRLEALLQRQQVPNINIGQPNINVPVNVAPPNVNVPINIVNRRDRVLDQPDAPLVRPPPPLVPAGPERMDDPHEDVPVSEEEEEEEQEVASSASSSSADPYEKYYSREELNKLTTKTGNISIHKIAKHLNIPTGFRDDMGRSRKYDKIELINRILARLGR